MIIAIEGHDGTGKTTLAKSLAKKLNFEYFKHPECELYKKKKKQYLEISKNVIKYNNSLLTSLFLSIGDNFALHYFKNKNVILDRHRLLNYFWNGNAETEQIFDFSIKYFSKPDLTILLDASPSVRLERLKERNPKDKDLLNEALLSADNQKIKDFLKKYDYNFIEINTDNLSKNQVLNTILKQIKHFVKI